MRMIRCGIGYDAHRLAEGRKLILGGVEIPHDADSTDIRMPTSSRMRLRMRFSARSGEGDIGHHFPNTDETHSRNQQH